MLEEFVEAALIAFIVPACGGAIYAVRHALGTAKRVDSLKHRMDDTDDKMALADKNIRTEVLTARETHREMYTRLSDIDKHLATLQAQMSFLVKYCEKKISGD